MIHHAFRVIASIFRTPRTWFVHMPSLPTRPWDSWLFEVGLQAEFDPIDLRIWGGGVVGAWRLHVSLFLDTTWWMLCQISCEMEWAGAMPNFMMGWMEWGGEFLNIPWTCTDWLMEKAAPPVSYWKYSCLVDTRTSAWWKAPENVGSESDWFPNSAQQNTCLTQNNHVFFTAPTVDGMMTPPSSCWGWQIIPLFTRFYTCSSLPRQTKMTKKSRVFKGPVLWPTFREKSVSLPNKCQVHPVSDGFSQFLHMLSGDEHPFGITDLVP